MVRHLKRWREIKWLTIFADKMKRFCENALRFFSFLLEWDLAANLSKTKLKKKA